MMKKRLILIAVTVLLCGLLAVGIVLVSGMELLPPETQQQPQFGFFVNSENIRVFQFSARNIDYIEVENAYQTYRVRRTDGKVQMVGFETVPLLEASAKGLFNSGETLRLETVIRENCQDMDEFGLADPQATVTILSYSGAAAKFHIGDKSPNGDYYYMCVDGENTVYLITTLFAERYLRSVVDYCDKKIYKTFVPYEDFTGLTVKSPEGEFVFRMATEEEKKNGIFFGGIAMEKPFLWGGDSTAMENVMKTMVALSATDVAAVCVEEKDLAQYGLDAASRTEILLSVYADENPVMYNNTTNPFYDSTKPSGKFTDFTVSYWVGDEVDGMVYVMYEDRAVVYTVPRDTFYWLQWRPYQYCNKMLFGEYLSNLTSLTVSNTSGEWEFLLKNADSNDKEELEVTCNGTSVVNTDFRTFYANLMTVYPSGEATEVSGKTPALTIRYVTKDGTEKVLNFYEMDARNYAAEVDGITFLSVRVTEVEKIFNDVQKLLRGESVMS